MSIQNASLHNTIKVADIAVCRNPNTQMADEVRQAAVNLIEKAHFTLNHNKIPSYIDMHMEPLLPVGTIHCTNQFSPTTSRCCVIARGYQKRDKDKKPEREVYAIMPLVNPTTANHPTTPALCPVVDEDGIIHVVLRSAVLPTPLWDVGENVFVSGAGVELAVLVRGRRYREDWEYALFEGGTWETEIALRETFEVVISLDFPLEEGDGKRGGDGVGLEGGEERSDDEAEGDDEPVWGEDEQ